MYLCMCIYIYIYHIYMYIISSYIISNLSIYCSFFLSIILCSIIFEFCLFYSNYVLFYSILSIYVLIFSHLHIICFVYVWYVNTTYDPHVIPSQPTIDAPLPSAQVSVRTDLRERTRDGITVTGFDAVINPKDLPAPWQMIWAKPWKSQIMYFLVGLCNVHLRPGRVCCPAKWIFTAQGQCFLHVGMSVKWQLGWWDLFPKRRTLESWRWRWRERNPKH